MQIHLERGMGASSKSASRSYEYYICEFIGSLNKEGQYDMDILPKDWIVFDRDKKKLTAPYPDPPYTKTVCDDLQESVKLAEQDWKRWDVALRGDSYEQAEARLKRLKIEQYAFTTDQGDPKSKADDETYAFKNESLSEILKEKSSNSSSDSSSVEANASTSSEEEIPIKNFNKKKKSAKNAILSTDDEKPKRKDGKGKKCAKNVPKSKKKIRSQKKSTKNAHSSSDDENPRKKSSKEKKIEKTKSKSEKPVSKKLTVKNSNLEVPEVSKQQTNSYTPLVSLVQDEGSKTPPIYDMTNNLGDHLDNIGDDDLLNHADRALQNIETLARHDNFHTEFPRHSIHNTPLIVNASSHQFSTEINSVLKAIVGLKILIQKLQGDVTDLKNKILGSDLGRLNELLLRHGIQLPMKTADEWKSFCKVLEEDTSIHDYISLFMKQQLDKVTNNPNRSCTNILKKIFEKKLILQFTAFKKMTGREYIFQNSACFTLMKRVILTNHRDGQGEFITEGIFNTSLSAAFSNSKDWGGRQTNNSHENEIE